MTTGPTDNTDAILLRDLAARSPDHAGPEPWHQQPEPVPTVRYSIVGDSLQVETGEGVTEVVLYDIPTLIAQPPAEPDPATLEYARRVLGEQPWQDRSAYAIGMVETYAKGGNLGRVLAVIQARKDVADAAARGEESPS